MLKKLLSAYESYLENNFIFEYKDIVDYSYGSSKSDELISLYNFRLSNEIDKDRISRMTKLIDKMKQNKEATILLHYIKAANGVGAIVYTSANCEKVIGVLLLNDTKD